MRPTYCLGLALALGACSNDINLDDAKVVVTTGLETDGWSGPPAVKTLEIARQDLDGTLTDFATLSVPTGAETVGFSITGGTARFSAVGLDAEGEPQVRGTSYLLNADGLAGAQVPLFVGRVRRFSRPGALAVAPGDAPALGTLGGRFLLAVGAGLADSVQVHGYDFGLWYDTGTDSLDCPVTGDCTPRSMAIVDGVIAILVGDEWASLTDFSATVAGELTKPSGLDSFADVAGGATFETDDLGAYIVGPTRAEATDAVLRVATDGTLSAHFTAAPRAGAAATWVAGRGLVVAGGSADAAGVEVLGDSEREFAALAFPPDDTAGAALVPFDGSLVLRVGGRTAAGDYAPTVAFDLGCSLECTPAYHSPAIDLEDVQAFRLEEAVLVVGTDADGYTAGRLLDASGVTEIELRDRRSAARALQTYLGSVAIVGGTLASGSAATSIELFTL